MLHLSGIKYKVNNTNEKVAEVDGGMNDVMYAFHNEFAYMYATDGLKGLAILIVDDDLNTVVQEQRFKENDSNVYHFTGIQHKTDGTDINIPLVDITGINAVEMRYHQEMAAMYLSDVLSGCGIKAYGTDLVDVINATEYKDVDAEE